MTDQRGPSPEEHDQGDSTSADPVSPAGGGAEADGAPDQHVQAQTPQEPPSESLWGPREDPWGGQPFGSTQPVDLDHTQVIAGEPPGGAPSSPGAGQGQQGEWPAPEQPSPWAGPERHQDWTAQQQAAAQQSASQQAAAEQAAAQQAGPYAAPDQGYQPAWDPYAADSPDAGYPGQGPEWFGSHHAIAQGAPPHKGPGWGALVGVAAVSALLAGLLGGVAGGWLGATDRLDFGGVGRPSSIPTVGSGATNRPEGSIANIAAKALPSVVTIKVKGSDGDGTGSGFVVDRAGHIITNNHVVEGAGSGGAITVQLSNGDEIDATVAGSDASYDLAVLKTGRNDLPPLTMGSSASVVVGDQVIAVGAPLGLDSTVTTGIVSALNRPVSPGGGANDQSFINAIQTDAAINPGNSGGPLLDMSGNVIGVNSAIARVPGTSDAQSGNIGVGFSIPSDQVRKTADQLIKSGKAEHPIIGVILDNSYDGAGAKIVEEATDGQQPVTKGGPAEKAGIKAGDIIIEFEGRKIADSDNLVVAIRAKSVGDEVSMKVRRGDREISVKMTLQGSSGK